MKEPAQSIHVTGLQQHEKGLIARLSHWSRRNIGLRIACVAVHLVGVNGKTRRVRCAHCISSTERKNIFDESVR